MIQEQLLERNFDRLRSETVSVTDAGYVLAVERGRKRLRRRRRASRVTVLAAAVILAGGVALSRHTPTAQDLIRIDPASSTADQSPTSVPVATLPPSSVRGSRAGPTTLSPEDVSANDLLKRQFEAGWIPAGPSAAWPGIVVPDDLWLHVTETDFLDSLREIGQGTPLPGAGPLYDRPEGTLVGFLIPSHGYVPIELLSTIDTATKRIAVFGCDPLISGLERSAGQCPTPSIP